MEAHRRRLVNGNGPGPGQWSNAAYRQQSVCFLITNTLCGWPFQPHTSSMGLSSSLKIRSKSVRSFHLASFSCRERARQRYIHSGDLLAVRSRADEETTIYHRESGNDVCWNKTAYLDAWISALQISYRYETCQSWPRLLINALGYTR